MSLLCLCPYYGSVEAVTVGEDELFHVLPYWSLHIVIRLDGDFGVIIMAGSFCPMLQNWKLNCKKAELILFYSVFYP